MASVAAAIQHPTPTANKYKDQAGPARGDRIGRRKLE
jgi:hypothetical protein